MTKEQAHKFVEAVRAYQAAGQAAVASGIVARLTDGDFAANVLMDAQKDWVDRGHDLLKESGLVDPAVFDADDDLAAAIYNSTLMDLPLADSLPQEEERDGRG